MAYKVIVATPYQDPFCKREFRDNDKGKAKAERFGLDLSRKHPSWKISIIKESSARKSP